MSLDLLNIGQTAAHALQARATELDQRRFRHHLSDAEQAELQAVSVALREVQALNGVRATGGAAALDVVAAQRDALLAAGLGLACLNQDDLDALARREQV